MLSFRIKELQNEFKELASNSYSQISESNQKNTTSLVDVKRLSEERDWAVRDWRSTQDTLSKRNVDFESLQKQLEASNQK
jgi:hypothetical protein